MEEVVVIIIQLFFEVGVQFFASPGVDVSLGDRGDKGCLVIFLHMLVGGGLGWLSILISPKLLLPYAGLRLANLIVGPLIAGGIAWLAAKKITKLPPGDAFLHGALFSFMFACARYAAAFR